MLQFMKLSLQDLWSQPHKMILTIEVKKFSAFHISGRVLSALNVFSCTIKNDLIMSIDTE